MTKLTKKDVRAALEAGEPVCTECGHKRSEHHYRHPFRPSHTTTLEGMAPDLAAAHIEQADRIEALEKQSEEDTRRIIESTAQVLDAKKAQAEAEAECDKLAAHLDLAIQTLLAIKTRASPHAENNDKDRIRKLMESILCLLQSSANCRKASK